jgi:ABC-type Fe3+ transport system permease subunit
MAEGQTDAAALGGGVVAVAMAMFADPGRYDLLGVTVAVALLFLIYGFLHDRERDFRRSLAVAAVVGILFLPILGWLADWFKLWPWSDFHDYNNWLIERSWHPMAEEPSTVSDEATFCAWALVAAAVVWVDRRLIQAELRRRNDRG